jgi:uncharacterized lipoprotein YmbA
MRTRIVAVLGIAFAILALPGCAPFKRSPDARFFVLRPLAEPPSPAAPAAADGLVGVLPVHVPGYLDRPQLVTELGADQVRVDEYARWAEPLPTAVTRTVAENLAILLPEDRVVRYPWPAAESMRCRVSVELRVLAAQGDGSVRLEGRWALLPKDEETPLVLRPLSLRRGPLPVGPRGVEPAAGVEAMSELLADLSREIAAGVRALPPLRPAWGPPSG